jgi:parallel beta-helix repeat protein
MRRVLVVAALAAFLAAPGSASANHVQCGDTITQDTTLDGDLTCAGNGIGIYGSNVTLNLNGHVIQGSGSGEGAFFDYTQEGPGVTPPVTSRVVGGTIRGFGIAVSMDSPDIVQVHSVVIEQNGTGVYCHYIAQCTVEDSVLRHNDGALDLSAADSGDTSAAVRRNRISDNGAGVGIFDYDFTLSDNRIVRNGRYGIWMDYDAGGDVRHNVVAGNGGDGLLITYMSHVTVGRNQIVRNGGNGVRLEGDFDFENTRATVDGNRIVDNAGDGILIENAGGVHNTLVRGNRADGNGDDGIDIEDGPWGTGLTASGLTVAANRAFFNADLGIEAIAGTTDGGGNKAKHNGNPAQCVGVRCK